MSLASTPNLFSYSSAINVNFSDVQQSPSFNSESYDVESRLRGGGAWFVAKADLQALGKLGKPFFPIAKAQHENVKMCDMQQKGDLRAIVKRG